MKLSLLFVSLSLLCFAQNEKRQYVSATQNENSITVHVSDGHYIITFLNSKILENTFVPNGQKHLASSHAVQLIPQKIGEIKYLNPALSNELLFGCNQENSLEVRITKKPFQIAYYLNKKLVISEQWGYDTEGDLEKIHFNLTNDELLYGGGARALGMNRRGNRLKLYNQAHYGYEERSELMNYTMPIVLSNKRYSIHFDNAAVGFLDLDSKKKNVLSYETMGGRKTYQLVIGDDWADLMKNQSELLGYQPIPPKWMFGNFASRFGYHSEQEGRDVVNRFRKDSIPLDAIIFDLYWFGKEIQGTLGNLEFYRDSFPEPEKMIRDFRENKVKTILITEPFILTTSKKWKEAADKKLLGMDSLGNPLTYNFYFGNTGLLDVFQPHVKDWFWNEYKKLANIGVAGFWGDLGEPEVHPENMFHGSLKANEVHNIYGHEWAKLIAEGYERDFPQQRPFILMRSGFSGTQKFGIIPWSGDVNRTWGGLKPQMEISMQMGMQGIGYMHSDLGGFAGALDDTELYLRWLQYGVFQPVFRPHAQQDVSSEPVFKDDVTKKIAKQAIELRYQLFPYNYNLAYENAHFGLPLMRPLFFEDSSAHWSENDAQQYMWGSAFLVHPVTNKNESYTQVRLPKNQIWYDFHSGKKIDVKNELTINGKEPFSVVDYSNSMDHIPVFVKGGSFVPMCAVNQSLDDYQPEQVVMHYYVSANQKGSRGFLYNDNGLNPSKKNKIEIPEYQWMDFYFIQKKKKSTLTISSFKTEMKDLEFVIHGLVKKPRKITMNGKEIEFEYNVKQELRFKLVGLKNANYLTEFDQKDFIRILH